MNNNTIAKPLVAIDADIRKLAYENEEKGTIVHCELIIFEESLLRIWPATFLIEDNGNRCKLVKAFNISIMPAWTLHPAGNQKARFTLLFQGLSDACKHFKLIEEINEPGGFYTEIINRNNTDVYQVNIKSA